MRLRFMLAPVVAQLEELMPNVSRAATCVAAALVLAACTSGSPSSTPSAPSPAASLETQFSPPASAVTSASPATRAPTVAASAPPVSASFTSTIYGYSLMVPAGWTAKQATSVWDGTGAPSHDAPQADQFVGPAAGSSWALVAPTTKDLTGYAKQWVAATAAYHGDTCPAPPEAIDPIKIGNEPGTLLSFNCGILINGAVTVHKGVGYQFGFRDPAVHAATDPADRAILLELLNSVRFPG